MDQLQLNPSARWQRTRLFMMHAPFDYQASSPGNVYHKYGVLLLAEYTNTPEDFDAQYPEFVRLLSKTHVLTDDMLLQYFGDVLSRCANATATASLAITVNPDGQPWVRNAQGLSLSCAKSVQAYRFAATGQPRQLTASYDFSKPQRPGWLTQPAYAEQSLTPAASSPANAGSGQPSVAPGPDAARPTEATAPAASAPQAAAPAPASVAPTAAPAPAQPTLNGPPAALTP